MGLKGRQAAHSRPSDRRRRTPDGRACCDNVVVRRDGGRSKSIGFVLYCIMHTLFLLLGLGSVLGLELGFSVKAVMIEVIWLHFISGPVT